MQENHGLVIPFKRNVLSKGFVVILISFFLTSIAHTARAEESPKDLKRSAIQRLTNLRGGNKKDNKAIQKAISHIQKSLADNLWENATHLAPAPKGKQVFHEAHKAVQQLKKIAQSKKISKDIKHAALGALQALVAADSSIADAALSEAGAYAGTSKRVDHFIQKSKENLQKGERLREQGQYARAIKCFEKAWHHARMAIKHAGEAQPPVDLPTVTITAALTSITQGESSTLTWSSTNAESVIIDNGIGQVSTSGSLAVSPSGTTTYMITATNAVGSVTDTATISVIPPPTVNITADTVSIILGTSATLSWTSTDADTVSIDNGVGQVVPSSSLAVSPTATTTYTITASNASGTATDTVTVSVIVPPIASISADRTSIVLGESVTLAWTASNPDTVTIDNGIGQVDPNGSITVSPNETTTYTITATNAAGSATDSVTISVIPPPTVDISASPSSITLGGDTTLSWTSASADTVTIDNGIGDVAPSGSIIVSPARTTTYTITATNRAGSTQSSATVTLVATVEPLPEGSFGKQYEDLVPVDATIESYDPKRFVVITGFVYGRGMVPLSGVTVSLHNHPEYGTATSDATGRFSIPADGGGLFTVVYEKEGFITAHRQVQTPWNDIAIVDDSPVLIQQDTKTTLVVFDGNPSTVTVHESTSVTDEFGTRACTMVFTGDNRAYAVDENGNETELNTVTTRATEFDTPESMQALLPPTSAYTYCADLTIDEAQSVRFEKPVVTYVDNFLGFDVGEPVPAGYYDNDRGVWVASDNGIVVKLLDTDSNGIVDALDSTGDDMPDDLNGDGLYSDEVVGLDYPPNTTYWRVGVPHFTIWDYNWGVAPPPDAEYPNSGKPPQVDQKTTSQDPCRSNISSSVDHRSRVFNEDMAIAGTDIGLHYASDRVQGYDHHITVPASGDEVPDSLNAIDVEVKVAGRLLKKSLPPLPNQTAEFVWDGLDYLGRPVRGSCVAHIRVKFGYRFFYALPDRNTNQGTPSTGGGSGGGLTYIAIPVFAQYSPRITGITGRDKIHLWQFEKKVIRTTPPSMLANGWTISPHHQPDLAPPYTLFKGNGETLSGKDMQRIIKTVAGTGTYIYSGDGIRAVDAGIPQPQGIALDPAGNLYIAAGAKIYKVDTAGIIVTVAGNGSGAYSGDGTVALDAALGGSVMDLVVDSKGNLYLVAGSRALKIDTNGILTTVAGNGSFGYSGDGGPAVEATFGQNLEAIAIDDSGNVYIADYYNHRVRKVDTNGIITTVAGNGMAGHSGDGGPSTAAQISYPNALAVDQAGNLYIGSLGNRIRKVNTSGTITTVAGNGNGYYSGDGGPAVDTSLSIGAVAVDRAGNLYVADRYNHRIRKIDTNGIISTIAGNGTMGYAGDEDLSVEASLNSPRDVALDPTGDLFVADHSNGRVRKITLKPLLERFVSATGLFFPEKNGLGHTFDSIGKQKATVDLATGATLRTFEYNEAGDLIAITDRFGYTTTIERDADGVPLSITSPDGIVTALSVDASDNLTRVTYPDHSFYTFEYTPGGLMTAVVDPNGNRFGHAFNEIGRLVQVTDPEGGNWQFDRVIDSGDVYTTVTTGEGNRTQYVDSGDSLGNYFSLITGPDGGVTNYTRTWDGRLVTKALSCGTELSFEYGIDPHYQFEVMKSATQWTPSGLEQVIEWDKEYVDTDRDELPDKITDTVTVNGKTATMTQDVHQGSITRTSPEARTITTWYDPATLLAGSIEVPGLYATSLGYDARGRLLSSTTHERMTNFTYDAYGNLATVTDAEGLTTAYAYDLIGRVKTIFRPDGSMVHFAYDATGNMTVLTTPSGVDHGFDHNGVNLQSMYTTPQSGGYLYSYDRDRRLNSIVFPSGKEITNVYTDARLTSIETAEGNTSFEYACSSKVSAITWGTERIDYAYDAYLVAEEALSGTLNQVLGYTYDNDFNVASFTYAGNTITYAYDNDGLLTGAGGFNIMRDPANGLPLAVTDGTFGLNRGFNGYGEPEHLAYSVAGASYNLTFTRDKVGRVITKAETIDGETITWEYAYDDPGRPVTVTNNGAVVEEYQYDTNGNRIYERNDPRRIAGRRGTYDIEDHILTVGSDTYQYDLDGFLTSKSASEGVTTYTYASTGELKKVTLPDGRTIEYLHDPLGRRIAKKVNGIVTAKYLWQGLTRLLAVYDGNDNLIMRFVYADARAPVAMEADGSTYYLIPNQVGSIRLVIDGTGNIIKKIDYDSFGNILNDSNLGFAIPFGFAGGLHDRDTGLVRFGFRDYDPETGRWTAKDPILFASGDVNLYGYCLGDPINLIDSLGLFGAGYAAGGNFWGHSDFTGGNRFDFTKEDKGWTSPIISPWRHFRDLKDVEKDLEEVIKNKDKNTFERLMHQGQDYFSHYKKGYRWWPQWDYGLGHLPYIKAADNDFDAWLEAEKWTKKWIKRWDNSCP